MLIGKEEEESKEMSKKLDALKNEIKADAERALKVDFPKKVFEIDEILKKDIFNKELGDAKIAAQTFSRVCVKYAAAQSAEATLSIGESPLNGDNQTGASSSCLSTGEAKSEKIARFSDATAGAATANSYKINLQPSQYISDVIKVVEPYFDKLIEDSFQVRLWIQFSIPRIEDGNNFGVGIQEEALNEIVSIEQNTWKYLSHISSYYSNRAKLNSKIAKYPFIKDFQIRIIDLDKKIFFYLKQGMIEVRNQYVQMHDWIEKNIDRIKTPRSNNSITMY